MTHPSTFRKLMFQLALAAVALALGTATVPSGVAQSFKLLHSFQGNNDGSHADGGLAMDASGNFFGTTAGDNFSNFGTVYRIDASGNYTVLYDFTGGKDGASPFCELVLDSSGNLYGTTSAGGKSGAGTIFKIDQNGKESVLHSFTGGSDGGVPDAGVIRDAKGNLYGTASSGGPSGAGVIFKLSPAGHLKVLYAFTGNADGGLPTAPLIRDAQGNLFGTAALGGASQSGVVFQLTPAGKEKVLYAFSGGKDGGFPLAGLVRDTAGNFYGTALQGGSTGSGTVFKLSKTGKFTVLHDFKKSTDGQFPHGGLVRDSSGTLYGTTIEGGKNGLGTIFRIDKANKETVVHSFAGTKDGEDPLATLTIDGSGNFYGATDAGGATGSGTVFRLKP